MYYKYDDGIFAVDSHYLRKGNAAVYILRDSNSAALVETANNASLPYILDAMNELSVRKEDVEYIFITHVHLDHAGGAGSYIKEFPNARIVIHPLGAPHLIDPQRIVAAASEVYGADWVKSLYGEIIPVDRNRIIAAEDGQTINMKSRNIICLATPGHARHHMAFFDEKHSAMFTGDALGSSWPEMNAINGRWIIPSTAPMQFDPGDMHSSIDKIARFKPQKVYLTHFGLLENLSEAAEELHRDIDKYVFETEKLNGNEEKIREYLLNLYTKTASLYGIKNPREYVLNECKILLQLNPMGLEAWYRHRSERPYRKTLTFKSREFALFQN
ncbi:MAG: MBL fold metallo-hydrolase [Synergistaceae bacterium]|jgi:glyoxylase-like metal-dependent hydrolase (beta-lactamase superfamily II)|nr:MBL fold metallo-hydrolase [Synergistaceae bacterium]